MKVVTIFLLLLVFAFSQDELKKSQYKKLKIGEEVSGAIDPNIKNIALHPIIMIFPSQSKKYLFIQLSSYETNYASLGVYSNQNGSLLFSCSNNTFDSCYIPVKSLKNNTQYTILVMSNLPLSYELKTYLADIEHVKPGQTIKFMFNEKDRTQLFHLDLKQGDKQFQQIRITLKPQTTRRQGDKLKIFASIGENKLPTQKQHQYASLHVWNDAQILFLTKDEFKNNDTLVFFIVGNSKTVYTLSCQLIKNRLQEIQLNKNRQQYIKRGSVKTYVMNFNQSNNVDTYVLRFSVFTGEVIVGFFYDQQMKKMFRKLPFQYMSDIQFHIQKQDLQAGTKSLYVRVQAVDVNSTFLINLQGRRKMQSFQILQGVSQFIPVKEKKQGMYFYSHIWFQTQYLKKDEQKFDIRLIKVEGNPKLKFYLCTQNTYQDICKQVNHQNFTKYTQPLKAQESTAGTRFIYTISVKQNQYKYINNVEKRALIVAVLIAQSQSFTFAAVQYSDPNKVKVLRQGRALEDKVRLAQAKYYKYINSNPNIVQIRVHFNLVSGMANFKVKRDDPRIGFSKQQRFDSFKKSQTKEPNIVSVKDKLTEVIYIQIFGFVSSIYTISVSPVHKQHPLSSSFVLAQNIQYTIRLQPFDLKVVEIHPIQSQIIFYFTSQGGSVRFCQINYKDQCIGNVQSIGNFGQRKYDSSLKRQIRFRFTNALQLGQLPKGNQISKNNNTFQQVRTVKITMIYRAANKQGCTQKQMNVVYSQKVKSGSCFDFKLPLSQDIQILASRQNIEKSTYSFELCHKKVNKIVVQNNRFLISGSKIEQKCKEINGDRVLRLFVNDDSKDDQYLTMDYSVEYKNDIITLADGVAYYTKTKSYQNQIKGFFYEIVDQNNPFQITLINRKGKQQFLGKIVNKKDRYNKKVKEGQASIVSQSKYEKVDSNPFAVVTTQDIAKSNCQGDCLLVLTIYSKQKPGTDIQFGVQVTQNQVVLKNNQVRKDFLIEGSIKYYEYRTLNTPTDLLFKISDNNRDCAKSYLSQHPYPSASNYILAEQQNTITYKNATKAIYYFSVQATADCSYTLSVNEGESKLSKLQFGQFMDFNLKQGEQFWLYLKHLDSNNFKLNTLLKFGKVNMYLNQSQLNNDIVEKISKGQIKAQQFLFKSQYQNSLTVSNEMKGFCSNCYYLLKLKAQTITQGSIFLGSQDSKMVLTQDKTLFDSMSKVNQSTLAIFYKVSKGMIDVNVHSGKISVSMKYLNQSYKGTFSPDRKSNTDPYQFKKIKGNHLPIQIQITALQVPAVYSIQINPQKQKNSDVKLNPGQGHVVILQNSVSSCVTGTLAKKENQFLIITDSDDNINLQDIKIEAKLNANQASLIKQYIGNIISIKFDIKQIFFTQAQKYQICLSAQNNNKQYQTTVQIMQIQNVTLIHPDVEVVARQEGYYVIHQNGYVIVDIFQCQGKSEVTYSSSIADLATKMPSQLQYLGIPGQNHAIRLQSDQILFLKINTKLSTLLWMPLNQQKQRGIGYYKYSIGRLQFSTSFNKIQFKIGGVYKSKQTKTLVQSVKYTLYVSNSRQILQKGVMCEVDNDPRIFKIIKEQPIIGEGGPNQIVIKVQKSKFRKLLKSNESLSFNVVADLILNPPDSKDQHQHYKFIYFEQLLMPELVKQNKFEDMDIKLLVGLIVIASVAIIAVLCVIIRWFIPMLARLKGRVLVQQANQQHRSGQMDAPPSSDRNQMSTGTNQRIK